MGTKRTTFLKIILLFLLIPGSSLFSEEESSFSPIDLSNNNWLVKEGFEPGDENGFVQDDKILVKEKKIPLIMNDIFKTPVGNEVKHFAATTTFQLKKSTLLEPPVIQLGWIGENWEVFLNGKSQRRDIFLKDDGSIKTYRIFRGIIIRLNYRDLKDGENTLVFHFLGDAPANSMAINDTIGFLFSSPYLITTADQIQGNQAEVLFVSLYTVYFFFGLYHILIYSRRSKDLYNLFFGLFSVFLSVYGMGQTMLLYDFFFDTAYVTRIKYAPQPLLPIFFVLFFFYYFYPREKMSIYLGILTVSSLALSAFFVLAPHRYLESGLIAFYFLFIPVALYGVYLFVKTIIHRKPDVGIMFLGVSLMILTTIFEILDSIYFNTGIRVVKYSFFLFVMSLVAILANRFLTVHNESERLNVELTRQKNAFGRFVPTQFLELLGKHSAVDITLGDNSIQTMSVLMCDLRSFTNLAEKMSAEETFRFLNTYLARMEPVIQHYDGFVDKFIGDAILALFSDHEFARDVKASNNSANRALEAALHMRRELSIYNELRKKEGVPPIEFGVGINTGPLVLGTVGSSHRIDTTVIGNTVNLAARLESLSTYYGANIIISDHTFHQLSNPDLYKIRELDAVYVKGKSELSYIYEVYDSDDLTIRDLKDQSHEFIAAGIQLYRNRQFVEAKVEFAKALERFPADLLPGIYLERCDHFIVEPPPVDWKGSYELTHK